MLQTPLQGGERAAHGRARRLRSLVGCCVGFLLLAAGFAVDALAHQRAGAPPQPPAGGAQELVASRRAGAPAAEGCLPNPHPTVPLFGYGCGNASHYCTDWGKQVHWEPVLACQLPPPQPFWMVATGTSAKGVGMGLIFWTSLDGTANMVKEWAVVAFTVGSVVVSTALLVRKAWAMDGFQSAWDQHQCWGIMMTSAPWGANLILYAAKVMSSLTVKEEAKSKSKREAAYIKVQAYLIILLFTLVAFLCCNAWFVVTNLIPTFVAYFPWAMCLLISFAPWLCFEKTHFSHETNANLIPMLAIPVALAFDTFLQWLALTSVYLWAGAGYWCSAWTAASERQSSVYLASVVQQVLSQAPWLAQLVNEWLP